MISTEDTVEAVSEWAVATLPELTDKSYAYATGDRVLGLPDIAVEIVDYSVNVDVASGTLRQIQQIEQIRLKVTNLELILVVPPNPPSEADKALKDFSDRLVDALLKDKTLGGRVSWAGNTPRVSFRPPYVEFDDGTQGRIVTLYLQIGQQLEA